MIDIAYINISILPIILLLTIYFNRNKANITFSTERIYYRIIIAVIVTMGLELMSLFFEKKTFAFALQLNWLFNYLYYVATTIVAFFWLLFTCSKMNNNEKPLKKRYKYLIVIPNICILIFITLNFFTHWVYSIDSANVTHDGPFYFISYLYAIGCYICSIIVAFIKYRKFNSKEQRKEVLIVFIGGMFPFLATIFEMSFSDFYIMWPVVTVIILAIFLNIQSSQIMQDTLTKVYRRYYFDKYFNERVNNKNQKDKWCLIILDINDLKKINDVYGHIVGDRAIVGVAETLKKELVSHKAFIARYGGDEFTAIFSYKRDNDIDDLIEKLHTEISKIKLDCPEKVSISIGYAKYSPKYYCDRIAMLEEADQHMYKQKHKNKNEKEVKI